jgi:hypothetical protein
MRRVRSFRHETIPPTASIACMTSPKPTPSCFQGETPRAVHPLGRLGAGSERQSAIPPLRCAQCRNDRERARNDSAQERLASTCSRARKDDPDGLIEVGAGLVPALVRGSRQGCPYAWGRGVTATVVSRLRRAGTRHAPTAGGPTFMQGPAPGQRRRTRENTGLTRPTPPRSSSQ